MSSCVSRCTAVSARSTSPLPAASCCTKSCDNCTRSRRSIPHGEVALHTPGAHLFLDVVWTGSYNEPRIITVEANRVALARREAPTYARCEEHTSELQS